MAGVRGPSALGEGDNLIRNCRTEWVKRHRKGDLRGLGRLSSYAHLMLLQGAQAWFPALR